jgi:putative spermidine/putrescine transport system permease protein
MSRPAVLPGGPLLAATAVLILLFLCLPILIVVPMSFSSASSLEFPPPGWSLRWYDAFFADPRWRQAGLTSLLVALAASTLALFFGSLAAYGLARSRFRGHGLLDGNFIAPLVIPQVITAVALYIFFARIGVLGSLPGLILGHTILGVPYVVLVMTVAVRSFDRRIEQAAMSCGATWGVTLRRIVLPNLTPSALAAWIFAFIVSFDEVIVTLFIAGSYETIPKRMFNELILQVNPTITAVATMLIAVSVLAMLGAALLLRRTGSGSRLLG